MLAHCSGDVLRKLVEKAGQRGPLDEKASEICAFLRDAYTINPEVVKEAESLASTVVFTDQSFANLSTIEEDIVSGLYLGERSVQPGKILARFRAVVSHRGFTAERTMVEKALIPFQIAFDLASPEWVLSWGNTVPISSLRELGHVAYDALGCYMATPKRYEALMMEQDEFDARFLLFGALILRVVPCPLSCGALTLYPEAMWGLLHDNVAPNAAFPAVMQMPFFGSNHEKCLSHHSIMTLVCQRTINTGEFVSVMSRNPFAMSTMDGEDKEHPANIWPLKEAGGGVVFTARDKVALMVTGPMSKKKQKENESALMLARRIVMASSAGPESREEDVNFAVRMLRQMSRENKGFDGGPEPNPWWPMVLPKAAVVILYALTEQARTEDDEQRLRVANALEEIDLVRCMDSMGWPMVLFDLWLHTLGHDYYYTKKVFSKINARAKELCKKRMGCDPESIVRAYNAPLPPNMHIGVPLAKPCIGYLHI